MSYDKGGIRVGEMSPKQRIMAMLKGQRVDRVPFIPFILGFAARNVGISASEFYRDAEKCYWSQKLTSQQYGLDNQPGLAYADYGAWEFGGEVRFPDTEFEQTLTVVRRPVLTEEDAWKLKPPDVKSAGYLPFLMAFSKVQLENEGRVTCPGMEPFAIAASTTGVERFCRWMMYNPKLCHHLIRIATEHRFQVLEYWAETFGIERIRYETATGPESNYVISPEAFEEFVFPYTKELHERVLEKGIRSIFCHICGDHKKNLSYWKQISFGHPGMVSFGPEVEISTAIEVLGDRNIIFGNVSPTVILTSSPAEIYEETRQCLEKGKLAPRGYVLMAGCEVSPRTPPYNLWVMCKAISDHGWYDN